MRTRGQRRSNDGAQIVRILDAIEQNDESGARLIRACENVVESRRSAGGGERDHALMIFRIGEAVELAAVFETHGNALLARELHDFFDARVLPALGNDDVLDGTLRFERFFHRVDAGQLVHGRDSLLLDGSPLTVA